MTQQNRAARRQATRTIKAPPQPRPAPAGKQWIKCIYPPCNQQVLVEKEVTSPIVSVKPKQMTLPMCPVHGEMCMFMMWLLPQVKIQQGVTPGGLVVPGQAPGAAKSGPKLVR